LSEQAKEIQRHAVIGGCIAATLVLADAARTFLLERLFNEFHTWRLVLILVALTALLGWVAFRLAFWGIRVIEELMRRGPLVVPGLGLRGCIDGLWIDAVVHNGRIVGASKFTIESSELEGFTVRGDTYKIEEHQTTLDITKRHGYWAGENGSVFGQDGMSYAYKGGQYREATQIHQQSAVQHFGVVYYQFFHGRDANKGTICFEGAFMAREEGWVNSIYHVLGKRIEKPNGPPHTEQDRQSLIEGWIRGEEVAEFASQCQERFNNEVRGWGIVTHPGVAQPAAPTIDRGSVQEGGGNEAVQGGLRPGA
jgi:hypothetical protein